MYCSNNLKEKTYIKVGFDLDFSLIAFHLAASGQAESHQPC